MNKKIIHTVFENRVEKNPNNIAIVYKNRSISYKALNSRANGVGYHLDNSQYIAIFLPNSIDYIVTLLAILKAGSVFVPMDILAPNDRIHKIIKKANIETIITNLENFKNLKKIVETLQLDINILILEDIEPRENNLELKSKEDSSAYLMFTSGSTGEPKAIIGMQKSLSHFIHWECKEFEIDERFKISQIAGVTFDVSLRDIFTALITGATLYIPTERTNIEYLAKWIDESGLTLIHIVPSLFRLLVKEFEYKNYKLSNLKHILLAGEALYGHDVVNFNKLYPNIELVNLYGPSETTLAKIYNRINIENIKNPNMIIPLGKAISNTAILILKNSRLAGVKQIGEIYIKTPFRSKGYLKEPQLTKELFIQNPLSSKDDIIYKTGDMGRYQADGTVEFIGRVDNQVKINGIRVELQEIEIAIKSYPKIDNAIIITEISPSKEIVVICYFIEKEKFIEDAIREYLIEVIPSYMIPNFFIKMDSFPLNFHGKIDKKSLPKPEDLIYIDKKFIEPKGKIEQSVADIFSQILRVKKISADITFTELGGNSLNSISATAKISHTFGVQINIKEFFENQSVAQLAKLIDIRLNQTIQKKRIEIEVAPKSESYELSNSQRRLWVLDKIQNASSVYNIAGAIEFDRELDRDILRDTIDILVNRHEILRTNFITIENSPRQIVKDKISNNIFDSIEVEDSQIYMQTEAERGLNLESDVLFYVKLINGHTLFVNMHHIISDGWSINVIIKELSQIYTALINNKELTLQSLPIQYKDYAYWQNRVLEDKDFLDKHQNYWHKVLKNPTTLNFPLDFKRDKSATFNGETLHFQLDKLLSSKIKNLSTNSTLFITLLTITNILLSKYSNQDDIIVGTPIANREEEILFNQIGFYVNTLVLRTQLNQNRTFKENLEDITKVCLESFSHQQYPFDKLVDELELDRDVSQNPLFNIMIVLQNNESSEIKFDTLKSKAKDIDTKSSKFDITFNYTEVNSKLELMVEYNCDLFKRSTIERVFENLETLIGSIELDRALNQIEFVSTNEQTLLNSFNSITREYPKDDTIIELFEKVVEKNPQNIALYCEDKKLTYRELNDRANYLSDYLYKECEIKPDTIVPILCDKSEWMIIALLGVLKSGGAYLPIDASYPQKRIEYILKDSQAKLLLTDSANMVKAENCSKDLNLNIIDFTSTINKIEKNLDIPKAPSDLAYMIYTSGTTGQPKGVMVENSGFVNMMLYQIESFGITKEDNVLQFASFSFDASVYETFLALLAGASYVIVNKDELLNNFIEITKKYSVNTAILNPTFLANIGELENFKTIITAGEKAIVGDAMKYAKKCNYINAYGPTEVSICSSFYKVQKDKEYTSIPIGQSIANIKNYILNTHLQELPIGAIGEIYTAGVGLARGYFNQPELTQEKFINHPKFGRIYKTGDIGLYSEEGYIEYLGRVDSQVKIRGNRVELSDIENTILTHKEVKEAIALIKNGELVVYIVGKEENLKAFLKDKLPDFMIPKYIIFLEKFPLTPNGKIDTKALPTPKIETKQSVKPQTPLEILLCDIYQDVLGVDVGIDDSFFDFGGDSIKAIQISSRVGALGYKLDIKNLFSYPKIIEIIPFIHKKLREINQDEVIGKIALTPIQKWFFDLEVNDKNYFNQDSLLEINTQINEEQLKKITRELLDHHDILRASYRDGVQFNNSISDTPLYFKKYEIFDVKEIKEISEELSNSFDVEKSPLVKFAYISLKNRKYLYIVAHHLVIDGVSWRILIEDLTTLYNGTKLPLKSDSFKDYSKKLESYAEEIESEIEFWQDSSFDFILKSDKNINKRLFKNQKSLNFEFDEKRTRDILENINFAYNTTTQDILIVALNLALFKSFGLTKSIVGLESHGREDILGLDLSRTVGWFTSLYPIVLDYNNQDLATQIKAQKESLRKVPHHGFGYGILKYLANKDLNFSKEILFNYLGQFEDAPKSLFNISNEETASSFSEDFISEFKLDISSMIVHRKLYFSVRYDEQEYKKQTIQQFLENYEDSLIEIINHCMSKESTELTPDDIDDEDFNIGSLSEFLDDLEMSE